MINLLVNCKEANDDQLKVLIIEDSIAVGKKLQELVSENPAVYILGQATSVGQALKMFNDLKPDFVFLDINLPDGNGLDTLIHLKRIKPALVVITFSNSASDIYKRKFKEMGSDYFLDKSKDFVKILEVVEQVIFSIQNKV